MIFYQKRYDALYTCHADAQGNVVAISAEDGTILEKYAYDVYGRLTAATAWNGSATVSVVDGDFDGDGYIDGGRSRSVDAMKKIARILLRGDYDEFAERWNSMSKKKIQCCAVAFLKDSKVYNEFHEMLKEYPDIRCEEWIDLEYEKKDIERAEVLMLGMDECTLVLKDEVFAECFEIKELCEECQRIQSRQIQDLRILPGQMKYDAQFTMESYIPIISSKFRRCIDEMGINDVSWRPVRSMNGNILDDYHQLIINARVRLLAPPTKIIYEGLCPKCGFYRRAGFDIDRQGHGWELYVTREVFSGIMLTDVLLGPCHSSPKRQYLGRNPFIVVTQEFYRETIRCGIRGLGFEPVTVIDQ